MSETNLGRRIVRSRAWNHYVVPAFTIAALLLAWEIVCRVARVPIWLLPPPSAIALSLWTHRHYLPRHILATGYEVAGGFFLALVVGVLLAVSIVYSAFIRRVAYPVLLVFQSVPKVAMAPLLLLYLGYGPQTNVTVAAIVAFFPIVINTTAGLESVEEDLLQLTRSFNPNALRVFWKVRLPWALPYLFSAMKVAVSLAVIGAVVGEFVGADRGLGYVILTASSNMDTSLVFAAMTLLALMGIGAFYAVWIIEVVTCPWYQPSRQDQTQGA